MSSGCLSVPPARRPASAARASRATPAAGVTAGRPWRPAPAPACRTGVVVPTRHASAAIADLTERLAAALDPLPGGGELVEVPSPFGPPAGGHSTASRREGRRSVRHGARLRLRAAAVTA